ncbi:MAG TPA: M48 family metallopeptidase [Gammaproteobacteria bacterium]|nr:M48 family metallopeptidase [Gammaproteobacteria bacterium]
MNGNTRLSTAALLAVTLAACATSPTGRRQLALVSEDSAIAASEEAYAMQIGELRKQGKIEPESSRVSRRVEGITERLVAQAIEMRHETADWDWSMEVIDDPEVVNAWCMAGGRMAVYTGLIQKLDPTDDELAQVLAHEISHALANHTAERMSVALATQAGVVLAGVLSDDAQKTMSRAAVAAALAVQLPNSRTAESEADEIGIELAAKAGYNPNAAVSLWQKMANAGGAGPPQFLSTHPSPANRQERLAELAPQMMAYYEQARRNAPTRSVARAGRAN